MSVLCHHVVSTVPYATVFDCVLGPAHSRLRPARPFRAAQTHLYTCNVSQMGVTLKLFFALHELTDFLVFSVSHVLVSMWGIQRHKHSNWSMENCVIIAHRKFANLFWSTHLLALHREIKTSIARPCVSRQHCC